MSNGKYVYVVDEDYDIFRKEADKRTDMDADIEIYSATRDKWVKIKRSKFDKMFKHYPFVSEEYYSEVGEGTVKRMIGVMQDYIKDNEEPINWKNTAFKNVELW